MPNREKYIKDFFKTIDTKVKFIEAINRDDLPKLSVLLKNKIINRFFLYKNFQKKKIKYPYIKLEQIENNPKYNLDVKGIKGTLALQLSYLKCFELFLKTKEEKCLIFEDDVILPRNIDVNILNDRIKSIFTKELKDIDWDIINLGRCQDRCNVNNDFSDNLVVETHPFCTHAVAYSRKVAEETLINSIPLSESGDWLMAWFYYNNSKFKCFSVKGRLFDQNETLGTLLGHTDKLPECKGTKVGKNVLKML